MRNPGKIVNRNMTVVGDINTMDPAVNSGRPMVAVSKGRLTGRTAAATLSTAGALTLTAAQLLGGLILRDPAGGNRTDTSPAAALLLAAMGKNVGVGSSFDFIIRNTADAAETITLGAGTGVTISGTATVAQNNSKLFRVVVDAVLPTTPAVTIYSVGTFVH